MSPIGSWGAASSTRLDFTSGLNGSGSRAMAFLVNAPQLLLSWFYLTYNNMLTSMATAHEYNQLGSHRKGLRVSKPEGEQRETYFLQLPLRWGIPLNACSGVLHWLASQTLFIVRLDRIKFDGSWDKGDSVAAFGFSTSALLALFVVHIALQIFVLVIASFQFTEAVPFSGNCSWVISAACHPPSGENDPALGKVEWGAVSDDSVASEGAGHCSFSSGLVTRPKTGRTYR